MVEHAQALPFTVTSEASEKYMPGWFDVLHKYGPRKAIVLEGNQCALYVHTPGASGWPAIDQCLMYHPSPSISIETTPSKALPDIGVTALLDDFFWTCDSGTIFAETLP